MNKVNKLNNALSENEFEFRRTIYELFKTEKIDIANFCKQVNTTRENIYKSLRTEKVKIKFETLIKYLDGLGLEFKVSEKIRGICKKCKKINHNYLYFLCIECEKKMNMQIRSETKNIYDIDQIAIKTTEIIKKFIL